MHTQYSNLTLPELLREADYSTDPLVIELRQRLEEEANEHEKTKEELHAAYSDLDCLQNS